MHLPALSTCRSMGARDEVKHICSLLSASSSFHFTPSFKTNRQRSPLLQTLQPGKGSLGRDSCAPGRARGLNSPMTLSSALAKMTPCLFSATHWYIPASKRLTLGMVREPCSSCTLPWGNSETNSKINTETPPRNMNPEAVVLYFIAGWTKGSSSNRKNLHAAIYLSASQIYVRLETKW